MTAAFFTAQSIVPGKDSRVPRLYPVKKVLPLFDDTSLATRIRPPEQSKPGRRCLTFFASILSTEKVCQKPPNFCRALLSWEVYKQSHNAISGQRSNKSR
jgi:hypothetical protein